MKKILLTAGLSLLMVIALFVTIVRDGTQKVDASVSTGDGYMFKVASSSSASATVPYKVRGGSGILGSIIISSSSPSVSTNLIRVYDSTGQATSSATSTLIASIRPGVSEQTLTFDVNVIRGIALDIPVGFNGFYIVTYR